ncbi:MAG: hypothetical protein IPI64_08450 [Chloracidobacterium sp.]|nr:hypothetical protein [Chloracidobacterium sp.]
MNRGYIFRLLATSLFLCACFGAGTLAQDAIEKAPPLPAGMTGADVNDPRYKLTPGLWDAGEAAFGMKHLMLLKKPDAFQLGVDSNSPQVATALKSLGVPAGAQIPPTIKMAYAGLAFANSDLAFQGNHLFLGNFYGMNIFDIADPANPKLLTSMLCPGGQGDVSVYKNLMFMSVEMQNGRLDCSTDGFPPNPPPAAGQNPGPPAAQKDRFRGVRIFDISDIKNPKQVGAVQTCRGSHTHTLVNDPNDKENVYIYVSGTSFVRPNDELAGCSDGTPEKNPDTAKFRIEVIKVPVAAPQNAKIVSSPRIFMDPRTGVVNGLNNGGSHDGDGTGKPADTDQCHDITVYSAIGLAAGACSGNGIILDIKDPANPKRVDAVNDKNYSYWHSAAFSNDGKKVVFTDEWGGGMGARCRPTDPNVWGANAIFNLNNNKLSFASYYKMPSAQGESENCVAHNGSLIPVPGRDIKVQAWYQGGISIMDFTDPSKPMEIAYFDRGPIDPKMVILGGSWSAYWYNGNIYSSEIARGLDVFELTPTKNLSQNEIDAAKSVRVAELNVQNQQKIEWSNKILIAKAYVDQLERVSALSAAESTNIRAALDKPVRSKLAGFAASVQKQSRLMRNDPYMAKMQALAAILKQPGI